MGNASLPESLKRGYQTLDFFLVLLYLLVFILNDLLSGSVCLVLFLVRVD